jgi:aspartyl/glutamyl-tRNA(Asn/Gln) amidotransferase C subunit
MTDEITPDLFEKLVELAALELDASQSEYLRRQLNNQLKAIHELEAIEINAAVPPALHGVSYNPATSPALRPDDWLPCDNPQEILQQAPQVEGGYIIVPDIPHTKLE